MERASNAVSYTHLRTIVETLLHRGVTVVVSEHRVHYLADLADEALLLRAGRVERRFAAGELARLTPEASHELGLRASSLDEVRAVPQMCIRDSDLRAGGGKLVLLLGASGCGKTTATRLLNGLVPHFFEGGALDGSVDVCGMEPA